jgi:hypothetical protein
MLWLFVFSGPYKLTLGVSNDVFNIFCGSSATLSGVLLGLVVAAVAFVAQSSFFGLSANIDILSRERQWVESLIRSDTVKNSDLVGILRKLRKMCESTITFNAEEIDSSKVKDAWSDMKDVLVRKSDEYEKRSDGYVEQLNELETKKETKINREKALKLKEKVEQIYKETQSLNDLVYHVHITFVSIYRVISLRLSEEVRKQFIILAYILSALLFTSLIFLALSGVESLNAEWLSDFHRLNMMILIGLFLIAFIPLLFRILNVYLGIISFDAS